MKRKVRKLDHWLKRKKKEDTAQYEQQTLNSLTELELCHSVKDNIATIRNILGSSSDVVIREFFIGGDVNISAAIVYIDGLTNSVIIDEYILGSLMVKIEGKLPADIYMNKQQVMDWIKRNGLNINELAEATNFKQLISSILSGDCAILLQGVDHALIANSKGWEKRGVSEPATEAVVRGPRDGFEETLRVNTALVRKRLKDPNLRVISTKVGERTNTDIAILYIDGIVDQKILKEVNDRINRINIDSALESGYIEQFIQDHYWSPFPQIQNTERPDKVTAHLLEGKIAIIVDGTPFVLIVPAIFTQFYHSPEDYYERFIIGSLIRFIRIISMAFALLLPSFYIAFSSYHPEMIPSKLVIAMAAGRSTVPFPSIVEAFLMEVTIEILREASIRLPGPVGPTIGIVGALVVGQAAVQAGIVSPIMVIVVSLTTIGSFAAPSYSAAISIRMLRFPIMIAAGLFGLYGIMLGIIIIIIHLCSLKSFGVPYMAPFAPFRLRDMKDSVIRMPFQSMKKRPSLFKTGDDVRIKETANESDDHNEEKTR